MAPGDLVVLVVHACLEVPNEMAKWSITLLTAML